MPIDIDDETRALGAMLLYVNLTGLMSGRHEVTAFVGHDRLYPVPGRGQPLSDSSAHGVGPLPRARGHDHRIRVRSA